MTLTTIGCQGVTTEGNIFNQRFRNCSWLQGTGIARDVKELIKKDFRVRGKASEINSQFKKKAGNLTLAVVCGDSATVKECGALRENIWEV